MLFAGQGYHPILLEHALYSRKKVLFIYWLLSMPRAANQIENTIAENKTLTKYKKSLKFEVYKNANFDKDDC